MTLETIGTGCDAEGLRDAAFNLLQRRYGVIRDIYNKTIDQYLLQKV